MAAQGQPPAPQAGLPFLFINQEKILTGSKTGQALLADEDRQRDAMRGEARALDASFEEEESKLTEQRPTMPPEEFRKLSDAFDARVVKARKEQDDRASALAQQFDQRRRQFYAQVAPILVMLMDRYGAKAIFDENSVLLADQSLNITQAVIAEIDARAATNAPEGAVAAPDAGTPAPEAPAPPEGNGDAGGQ
ncbi:MAG: OmpH family outer membrane protein [Amaricoccus sp.]